MKPVEEEDIPTLAGKSEAFSCKRVNWHTKITKLDQNLAKPEHWWSTKLLLKETLDQLLSAKARAECCVLVHSHGQTDAKKADGGGGGGVICE